MRSLVLESLKSPKLCKLATVLYSKSQQSNNTLELIDTFLRSHFVYFPERIETLQTPEYMLTGLEMNNHLTGDCDDISTLHAALLTCLAFPVRFVAIRSTWGDPNFDHVYIEVLFDKDWLPFDVTIPLGTEIEYFARLAIQV